MSDRGSIGRRLPPEPAPRGPARYVREMSELERRYALAMHEGCTDGEPHALEAHEPFDTEEGDEPFSELLAKLERHGMKLILADDESPTIADVQAVAERLELVYVPAQHRLHAAPREECNIDDSMLNRHVLERDLDKVDPNVQLCKHCVSPEDARIIRAGLRRL